MSRYVIGLDQSTSGTTAVLLNRLGHVYADAHEPVTRYIPRNGWVEQDAEDLWLSARRALRNVVHNGRISPEDVEAIGVTNQRETLITWDRVTGEPIGRAIGWQDRRTLQFCDDISASESAALTRETGMTVVTNAAGPKLAWLLTHDRRVQSAVARGTLQAGTVDSWIIWNLSGRRAHITDHSNASVTLLQEARTLTYSSRALHRFGIPRDVLPDLRTSSEVYALTEPDHFLGARVPIAACIGDQQSATFGQACAPGVAKNTYGSGAFTIVNAGPRYVPPGHGLFSPVLWTVGDTVSYGFESMNDESGGVLTWLRDGLGVITDIREAEALAAQAPNAGGLHLVPAGAHPAGGAPHGGVLLGLTNRSSKQQIARAALESIAFQVRDRLEAIARTSGRHPEALRADGAGAANDLLLQFQADILGIAVERPTIASMAPVGSAYLAGLAVGFWDSQQEVDSLWTLARRFEPSVTDAQREQRYADWLAALHQAGGAPPAADCD